MVDKTLSFGENFSAGLEDQYYTNTITGLQELEFSGLLDTQAKLKELGIENRLNVIGDRERDTQRNIDPTVAIDAELLRIRTENPGIELPISKHADLKDYGKAKLAKIEENYRLSNSQTGTVARLASMAGTMVGFMKDPINAITSLIPVKGLVAAAAGAKAVVASAVTFGAKMGAIEAPKHLYIQPTRGELGLDYGIGRAGLEVSSAAIGSGLLGLAGRAIGGAVRAASTKISNQGIPQQVVDLLEGGLDSIPREIPGVIKPSTSAIAKTKIVDHWNQQKAAAEGFPGAAKDIFNDTADQIIEFTKGNPLPTNGHLESVLDYGLENQRPDGTLPFSESPHATIVDLPAYEAPFEGFASRKTIDKINQTRMTYNPADVDPSITDRNLLKEYPHLKDKVSFLDDAEPLQENQLFTGQKVPSRAMPEDTGLREPSIQDPLVQPIPKNKIESLIEGYEILDPSAIDTRIYLTENGLPTSKTMGELKRASLDFFRESEVLKGALSRGEDWASLVLKAQEGVISKTLWKEFQGVLAMVGHDPKDAPTLEIVKRALEFVGNNRKKIVQKHALDIHKQVELRKEFQVAMAAGVAPGDVLHNVSLKEPWAVKYGRIGASRETLYHGERRGLLADTVDALRNVFPEGFLEMRQEKVFNAKCIKEIYARHDNSGKMARSTDGQVTAAVDALDNLTKTGIKHYDIYGGDGTPRADYLKIPGHDTFKMRHASGARKYADSRSIWVKEVIGYGVDMDNLVRMNPDMDGATPEKMAKFLGEYYDKIMSGAGKSSDALPNIGGKRNHARQLQFATPEGLIAYQEKYGSGGIFDAANTYINNISSDVANLQSYGTEPDNVKNLMYELAETYDPENAIAIKSQVNRDMAYNLHDGDYRSSATAQAVASTTRSLMAGNLLGGTVFSAALVDIPAVGPIGRFLRGTKMYRGMGTALKNSILPSLTGMERSVAVARLGFLADTFTNPSQNLLDNVHGGVFAKGARVSAMGTIKGSGLIKVTNETRMVHTMMAGFDLTDSVKAGFDSLHPRTKSYYESFGLNREAFDVMRDSAITKIRWEGQELDVIDPMVMFRSENKAIRELGQEVMGMMEDVVQSSSPSFNPNAEAVFNRLKETNVGAILGGGMRTFTGYLTGAWRQILRPSLEMAKGGDPRAFLGYVAGTTAGAYAVMQIMDVLNGRDPRPLSPKAIMEAVARSGSLPVLGDFAGSYAAGYTLSIAEKIFPPSRFIGKFGELVIANPVRAAVGLDTKVGANAISVAESIIPNPWFTKALVARGFDKMGEMLDPEKAQKNYANLRRAAEKKGSGYWMDPDSFTPSRGPDLSNMFKFQTTEEQDIAFKQGRKRRSKVNKAKRAESRSRESGEPTVIGSNPDALG